MLRRNIDRTFTEQRIHVPGEWNFTYLNQAIVAFKGGKVVKVLSRTATPSDSDLPLPCPIALTDYIGDV